MPVSRVVDILRNDHTQIKPNCALILVDFLARYGIISKDEPGFADIAGRCHRDCGMPEPVAREGKIET